MQVGAEGGGMGRRERRELGRKEEKERKYTILRNILRSLRGKEAEGKKNSKHQDTV